MSTLTSYLIIAFVFLNILGCYWLLRWTSKAGPPENQDASVTEQPSVGEHAALQKAVLLPSPSPSPSPSHGSANAEPATTGHVWDHDLREFNNPLPRWWLNMFYLTIVFALIYLMLYPGLGNVTGYLGWSSRLEHDRTAGSERETYLAAFKPFEALDVMALAKNPIAMQMAQNIFNNNCAACHGADARGAKGFPNLSDHDWLYGGDADAIGQTLSEGRVGAMPGWQAIAGDEGVAALAAYVQQISGAPAGSFDAAQAASGMTQYMQFCIACHGPNGKGNQAMGAPNLTDQIWLYGGDTATLIETLANGRAGVMPSQKAVLTDTQIKVMTAWVMAQSQKTTATGAALQPSAQP